MVHPTYLRDKTGMVITLPASGSVPTPGAPAAGSPGAGTVPYYFDGVTQVAGPYALATAIILAGGGVFYFRRDGVWHNQDGHVVNPLPAFIGIGQGTTSGGGPTVTMPADPAHARVLPGSEPLPGYEKAGCIFEAYWEDPVLI